MAAGVNKAWGLARLCRHLQIPAGQVLAFGDALNDLEMLSWAGHSVAMSDAPAELRAAAQEVTGSNAEDGVAAVLERLLREG